MKLSQAQRNVIDILSRFPNEMIMHDGYITGGHGICFDMRTVKSLEKRGIIVRGKLIQKP